jgi:hypothetical protein
MSIQVCERGGWFAHVVQSFDVFSELERGCVNGGPVVDGAGSSHQLLLESRGRTRASRHHQSRVMAAIELSPLAESEQGLPFHFSF